MDAILELERLELVAKVVSELNNHLGTSDKTLAEYIIGMYWRGHLQLVIRESLFSAR